MKINPGHTFPSFSFLGLDRMLIAFLRVMVMSSEEQLEKWHREDKTRDLLNEELSEDDLDKKAYTYLQTRCTLLLRSYPTTLEKDEAILKGEGEEGNDLKQMTRFCVQLRAEEKRILNDNIEFCKNKLLANA